MKILWFTSTPSNASLEFGYKTFGVSWVSSLQTLVEESELYELRICFFYEGSTYRSIKKGNVIYYGIPFKKGNPLRRIINRHFAQLVDEEPLYIDEIIDEFKPDLIHVFGTENGYGKILIHRSEKVLFFLQGMVGAITDVYFPPGFNKLKVLIKSDLSSNLRGISFIHTSNIYRKWAKREQDTIRKWKYFNGRTAYDRNYVKLLNPDARYFHCEDMLRKEFFADEWIQPCELNEHNVIVIGTTFRPNIYKGLDLIYKVLDLLKEFRIHWKIFGTSHNDPLNKLVKRTLRIDNKMQNIKFYGQISTSDLVGQLKTCHFFVHPSYIDNGPNSVCEAMLLGMPVLASSVGGITSLINNGETGFLFNPYDKYDLAGLLVHLINNYDKAKEAGLKARNLALKRHSPDAIISELNNIYNFIYNDI